MVNDLSHTGGRTLFSLKLWHCWTFLRFLVEVSPSKRPLSLYNITDSLLSEVLKPFGWGEILKKNLKNVQVILKSWATHFDSVPQCRFDRLHQRLLGQDLKNGRLLVGSGGGKVSSGLRHGCPTISIWQLMAIYATLHNNGLNNKHGFLKSALYSQI